MASKEDHDALFKILTENINKLKTHSLVDESFTVDDYLDIGFNICTSQTPDRSKNSWFRIW